MIDKKKKLPNGRYNYWRDMLYDDYKVFMARREKTKDGKIDLRNPRFDFYKDRPKQDFTEIDIKRVNELFDEMLTFIDNYTDIDVIGSDKTDKYSGTGGIEADDEFFFLMNSIPKNVIITVVSNDKDMRNTSKTNIRFYEMDKDKYNTAIKSNELESAAFYLKGDSTDGISGVIPRHQWKKALNKIIDSNNCSVDEAIEIEFKNLYRKASDLCVKYSNKLGRELNRDNILDLTDEEKKQIKIKQSEINRIVQTYRMEDRYKYNKKLMDSSLENMPKQVKDLITEEIARPRGKFDFIKTQQAIKKFELNKYVDGMKSIEDRYEEFQLSAFDKTNTFGSVSGKRKRRLSNDLASIEDDLGITITNDNKSIF